MSATNAAETAVLELIFKNTNWANIGDATGLRGSSVAGSLYISLHTADPGEAGSQTTSEATYTSYARVAVARSGAGWVVSGANASNAAAVTFPACTGGSNTITRLRAQRDQLLLLQHIRHCRWPEHQTMWLEFQSQSHHAT